MEVRVVTKIQNTPENVWKILTDETLFSEWSGIQADTAELREGGFIWLKAKGNEPPTELFVTAFEEGKMITLSGPETDETYRLYPDEGGCMLEKSISPKDGRNFEGEEYPKEVVRQQAFLDAFKSIAEKRNDPAKTVPVQKKIENPKQKEIKKRSPAKKWIILVAGLVILIGAGIASWFFLINPYLEENDRIRKYNSGAEAIEAGKYAHLNEYEVHPQQFGCVCYAGIDDYTAFSKACDYSAWARRTLKLTRSLEINGTIELKHYMSIVAERMII